MSVRQSLAWSFSQEFVEKVVRFAGSIVIARLLTPDEVGVFSIAMATTFLIDWLRNFGVNQYLIREPELTQDKVRTVFGISLALQWSLAAFVLLIRDPLAQLYSEPGIADVLLVVVLTFFVSPFGGPAQALLRRDMRFDLLHHITVASVLLGTAATITLAAFGLSYMALAWGMLCGNVVRTGLTLMVRSDHIRLRPGLRHWEEVLQFGGWLTIAGFCGTSALEVRKLVLGVFASPAAVALFERSEQIPLIARQSLFLPIGRVLLPSFSSDIREGRSIGPKVKLLIAATTGIIWPAFVTIGFLSVPITVLLFGENWREAGEILPYVLVATGFLTFLPQPETILTPLGMVRRLAKLRAAQAVAFIVLGGVGAYHSLAAFAVMQIIAYFLLLALIYFATKDYLGTRVANLVGIYARSTGVAVGSGIPALIGYIKLGTEMNAAEVALILGATAIFWLVSIFVVNHALKSEIREMGKIIAGRASSFIKGTS